MMPRYPGDDGSISETDCGANETNLRFVHFIHQVYHLLVNLKLNKWHAFCSLFIGSDQYLLSASYPVVQVSVIHFPFHLVQLKESG